MSSAPATRPEQHNGFNQLLSVASPSGATPFATFASMLPTHVPNHLGIGGGALLGGGWVNWVWDL